MATSQPSAASARATARPIPLLAPARTAFLPRICRSITTSLIGTHSLSNRSGLLQVSLIQEHQRLVQHLHLGHGTAGGRDRSQGSLIDGFELQRAAGIEIDLHAGLIIGLAVSLGPGLIDVTVGHRTAADSGGGL